jgi:uncharacterized iron-regulated protein
MLQKGWKAIFAGSFRESSIGRPAAENTIFYASMRARTYAILTGVAFLGSLAAPAQENPAHPATTKTCLAPAAWYTMAEESPRAVPGPELLAGIATRDVVLLGEQHGNADHHQWQLQTLAALHLLRPQMVIGFEAFPRRVQPALDKWIAGELGVKQFLDEAEWEKVWGVPAERYLPLLQFARINRLPIVALNVERALTQAIRKAGWDAVPAEQKEGVSRPAPASPAYLDHLFEVFGEHRRAEGKATGAADRDTPAFRYFIEAQITWDRAMAEALARSLNTAEGAERPLVVGIMGAGHVRHGHGVPHQLRAVGVASVATLLPVDSRQDCSELRPGFADAVFSLLHTRRDKPSPPRLGVRLEQAEGAVSVVEVIRGSLAEMTGLQRGDRIVSVAGAPAVRISGVIGAIRNQPAGTWLPIRIRRGEELHDLLIKFPP